MGVFYFGAPEQRAMAWPALGFESRSREPAGGSGEAGSREPRSGGDEVTRDRSLVPEPGFKGPGNYAGFFLYIFSVEAKCV